MLKHNYQCLFNKNYYLNIKFTKKGVTHHVYALLIKRLKIDRRCSLFTSDFKNIDSLKDLIKVNQYISEVIKSGNMPNKTSRKSLKKPITL